MYRQKQGIGPDIYIRSTKTQIPQGKAFQNYLSNTQNKKRLTAFLNTQLLKHQLQPNQVMVVSIGESDKPSRTATLKKNNAKKSVAALASHQDEADGILMLHVSHASSTASQIIICSPDTDVLALAVHFCADMGSELWVKTGSGKNVRYVSINMAVSALDRDLLKCVLPFHALTGCDSVSFFSGKGRGKGEAWKTFIDSYENFPDFAKIGDELSPSEDVEQSVLHSSTSFIKRVN